MATLIFLGIAALVALAAFALAVAWVRRYPPVGVVLVALILIPLWELQYPPPIVTFSGLSVYPADLITLVLFAVGALEFAQLRANLGGWLAPWVLFGVCIAVSLFLGVAAFGPGTAINAARVFLYFFFAMTWALAVRPDRLRLHTVSLVLGWALVLVALYHGFSYGFGGPASSTAISNGFVQSGRVLIGTQAMVLLLCAATVFLGRSRLGKVRSQFSAISSLVFGGVVLIAQHRSVWISCAVGMVAVFIWSGRKEARRRAFVLLAIGAWLALVGWAFGFLDGSEWVGEASSTKTYDWRTSGWRALITQAIARGPFNVVFGDPFGGSASLRQVGTGQMTSVSAHNWYLDLFLNLGVIGLITLLLIFVAALAKSRPLPSIWTFSLAAIAAYSWAYSVEWYLAPWFGAAVTMSLRRVGTVEGSFPKPADPVAGDRGSADRYAAVSGPAHR
jgi:hypothetical protein